MYIMQIVFTLAWLQFAKSKAVLRNDIKSATTISLLSSHHLQLQEKHDTAERANLPKDFQHIDHHLLVNFTINGTEIENMSASIMKKNLFKENFTTNEIHKESDANLLHRKALPPDLENYPETVNEKHTASITGKSLPSENENTNNALILMILSVFIVTLVLVISFTVYTRNSQISIEMNENNSKDEKKLRYREVATEEQHIDIVNSDNSWRNTLASKITTVTRRLKSVKDLLTLRNEADVQISKTPSTHTLSSRSHHSIEMESCIDTTNETAEENVSAEREEKEETVLKTQRCRKNSSFTSGKAHNENLDTSNSICSKCNHYRDPHIVVKRINEIQRRGGRIHIPIQLPVVLGSNKIKSVGFHKLSGSQPSTISVQKKCHRGSCCVGIKSSRASSSSGSFQKNGDELDVSASSKCKFKAIDDCLLTSSSSSLQQKEDKNCNDESGSFTGKSKDDNLSTSNSDYSEREKNNRSGVESCSSSGKLKTRDDCPSTTGSNYSRGETNKTSIVDSGYPTEKSISNEGVLSSNSVCSHQNEDEQCYTVYDSSSGKSKENYDCLPSKSSTSNRAICSKSRSTKSSTSSKWKSKSKSSSCNYPNSLNTSSSRSMNTDYESSSRTQNSESQTEGFLGTISAYTNKTGSSIYDVSDAPSKDSSSTYDVTKVKICEVHYKDEECQSAPSREWYTNSSAGCSKNLSSPNLPSIIDSYRSTVNANTSEIQFQSDCVHSSQSGKPNVKKLKNKSTEENCEKSNQQDCQCTHMSQSSNETSSSCSNLAYKAPVKFKVLSTDPNFDPSTLHVKQQLKMLLSEEHNSKKPAIKSNKDKLQPGQVIYADLCFVQQQSTAGCANVNACLVPSENKDSGVSSQSSCSAISPKHSNVTSESDNEHGYGASQTESTENGYPYGKDHNCCSTDECNDETDSYYGNCGSKICYDDSPRSNLSRKFSRGWGRRASIDTTLKSSSGAASRGMLIQSLNQRLKGTYLSQTKSSSSSRFASSSRCAPVLEFTVDDDDYDVYEPVEEQLGTGTSSMRNSMNKILPKIRSYMSRRKKSSTSCSEQVYEEPSVNGGTTELCENCLKHVPNDISKTIRSRQSLYSNVDKFKSGGTIHLNDLIEMYPNLYPKLPSPIREALSKCFDEVSTSPYGNLCDNYERVQERKWSELSSSFENINYMD